MNPQIIHFNRVFPYKPSIRGYPNFWKHPYIHTHTRCSITPCKPLLGRSTLKLPLMLFAAWPAWIQRAWCRWLNQARTHGKLGGVHLVIGRELRLTWYPKIDIAGIRFFDLLQFGVCLPRKWSMNGSLHLQLVPSNCWYQPAWMSSENTPRRNKLPWLFNEWAIGG